MSMTAAEARVEIKGLYTKADEIERKYPDGLTEAVNAEDYREVKRLLTEVDGLEEKLAALDDAAQRKARLTKRLGELSLPQRPDLGEQGDGFSPGGVALSPGAQFAGSDLWKSLKQKGAFETNTTPVDMAVELAEGTSLVLAMKQAQYLAKALVYSGTGVGGALVPPDIRPGVLPLLQREVTVLDLLTRIPTSSNVVEWVYEASFTNNAAQVAEATATTGTSGLKPESGITFLPQQAVVKTTAHWIPVTNRMLADAPQLRGLIDNRLILGLELKLEEQIVSGDGTGENHLGILNTPGIITMGAGADPLAALWNARTQVRVQGHTRPTAYLMNPNDWGAIRLTRENSATATAGNYLWGPPSQVGAPTLWGLPVVEAEAMTENTAVCADFAQGGALYDRETAQVRVGLINDQFVRNLQTLLAELRALWVIYRPLSFAKVTGV